MTIEVERAHLVVHLSQRSTLHGVNLRKKLWKCSQRSLKEDNPVKDVIFLQIQSLDILYPNVPWSCRPYWYSNVITCTDSTVEHTEDEGLGANILVLRCVRWQKLELSCRSSIREKFSQVNRPASNCLTWRNSKKKKYINKKKTDEEENEILSTIPYQWWRIGWVISGRRDRMWWWSLYLWNKRLVISAEDFSRFGGSICFNSKLCSGTFRNFPSYGSKGISVTFFCFMHLLTLLFVSMILTCLY